MTKSELESKHIAELHALAAEAEIPRYRMLRREELVDALLEGGGGPGENGAEPAKKTEGEERPRRRRRRGGRGRSRAERAGGEDGERKAAPAHETEDGEEAEGPAAEEEIVTGVVDVVAQGHGFVRLGGLDPRTDDVYISASQIRRCELRSGDEVTGPARGPRRGERHRALTRVDRVNGAEPSDQRPPGFDDLTPVAPHRRIPLTVEAGDVLVRAADLLAPLGYGQRVLIRSRPRSGRTTLLRGLVKAIGAAPNPPGIVVLLVDERPEEVTQWRREAPDVEIAAAAADLEPADQVRHAELALSRAKRRAEAGEDVVLVVDSLTRLGVAHGDPATVKPVFGAGRELEEEGAGSLTVIATVLAGTEDGDGALEATETTENATLVLDADLAAAGVVPALDASVSGISGEELLRPESELAAARAMRAELRELAPAEAATRLRELIEASASNTELLAKK
jgi:transcription termination factor Rho